MTEEDLKILDVLGDEMTSKSSLFIHSSLKCSVQETDEKLELQIDEG